MVNKKYYKIDEERLIELLQAESELRALSRGGVDNWGWVGDSYREFLHEAENELGLSKEEREDFNFYNLAERYLSDYEVINEI